MIIMYEGLKIDRQLIIKIFDIILNANIYIYLMVIIFLFVNKINSVSTVLLINL